MSGAITRGRSAVHKFNVAISNQETRLPICPSARVVHVDAPSAQVSGIIQVWVLTPIGDDGQAPPSGEGRRFWVHGTGHPIPGGRTHCGTVLTNGYVWHVFEEGRA